MGKHRWPISADTLSSTASVAATAHAEPDDDRAVGDGFGAGGVFGPLDGSTPGDGFAADDGHDGHDADDEAGDLRGGRDSGAPDRPVNRRSGRGSEQHGREVQPGIRWGVARSAALVFLGVALAVGAALFLVRSSEPSAAAVSVQLGAEAGEVGESAGSADTSGSDPAPASSEDTDEAPAPPRGGAEGAADPPDAGTGTGSGPGQGAEGSPRAEGTRGDRAGSIVVYVTGAVASPGVVTMPAGTRLFEILERVGGPLPEADLEGINLAGLPADGEHLHVLAIGEVPRPLSNIPVQGPADAPAGGPEATAPGGPAGTSLPSAVIDINTATLADIESLPRVGPVLGQRIIEWRDTNGPFARASDIDSVPGIGPALLEGIIPLITVR